MRANKNIFNLSLKCTYQASLLGGMAPVAGVIGALNRSSFRSNNISMESFVSDSSAFVVKHSSGEVASAEQNDQTERRLDHPHCPVK